MQTPTHTGIKRPRARVELVSCRLQHAPIESQTCTTTHLAGPVKFLGAGAYAYATLSRAGDVDASGYAWRIGQGTHAWLLAPRPLASGSYLLTLSYGRGSHRVTIRKRVLIR